MEFAMSPELLARRDILRLGGAALTLASPAWLSAVADAQTAAFRIANRENVGERATVAEDIARWIVDLRYEELPANVIARAERVLLDTVGCALGAIGAEPVQIARKLSRCREGIRKRRSLASVERFPASKPHS